MSNKRLLTVDDGKALARDINTTYAKKSEVEAVSNAIPTNLSDLQADSSHRTVTDNEKSVWNNKSNFSGNYNDLTNKPTIPTALSDLTEDLSHRTVTDTEKQTWNNKSNFSGNYNDLTNKPSIPSKTSDLTNNSGFITNTVNNLVNYYLKSEVYTKAEVEQLIATISTLHFEVVSVLPTEDIQLNAIYLLEKSSSTAGNVYDEYVYINNAWELIGSTQIDLSNYVTIQQLNTALASYVTTTNLSNLIADYYTKSEVDGLLANKVTVVSGKGLSTNDYTTNEKNKLAGIQQGAEVNVQADWDETDSTSKAFIQNKPNIVDVEYATASDIEEINDILNGNEE